MAPRRLSREQSRRQTRRRLLEAAAEVFAARGYRGATVEQIASTAGYTVGALYSNFDGKDDLLLALLEQEIARLASRISAAAGGAEGREGLRRGAREWMRTLDEESELYALLIEFWTIWVRDPKLRPRHAERFAALRRSIGEAIKAESEAADARLAIDAEDLGAAVVALADGIALQRLADPGAIPDELLGELLEALVRGLAS